MVLVAGVSLNVSAQFKIGGKSINTKKLVNAASDAAKAVTLSDEDVAAMAREYIQWMDTHNEIAGPGNGDGTAFGKSDERYQGRRSRSEF